MGTAAPRRAGVLAATTDRKAAGKRARQHPRQVSRPGRAWCRRAGRAAPSRPIARPRGRAGPGPVRPRGDPSPRRGGARFGIRTRRGAPGGRRRSGPARRRSGVGARRRDPRGDDRGVPRRRRSRAGSGDRLRTRAEAERIAEVVAARTPALVERLVRQVLEIGIPQPGGSGNEPQERDGDRDRDR